MNIMVEPVEPLTELGELGLAASNGSRSAEQALYQIAFPRLVRQLRKWLGAEDAEDIAQDAFVLVLRRLREGSLAEPEKAYGYLLAVARNMAKAHVRKLARRATSSDTPSIEALPSRDASPLENIQARTTENFVRELVDELTVPRDREMIQMLCLQELDRELVCDALALSPRQLSRVYYRSKERLKEVAERKFEDLAQFA